MKKLLRALFFRLSGTSSNHELGLIQPAPISSLSRPAKFRYLDEAVPEIVSEKGSAPVHILFIERRTKPRKATSGLE